MAEPRLPRGQPDSGTRQSELSARFLDPNRPDPFGGTQYGDGTLELYNSDLNTTECLELGEPGWDQVTGTLRVDCAHGRENSPYTGAVNRAAMGYGTQERSREVGAIDNAAPIAERATARRHPGLWTAPDDYGWFEHSSATLGCLLLRAEENGAGLVARAEDFRQFRLYEATANYPGSWYEGWLRWQAELAQCVTQFCMARARAGMAAHRAGGLRSFRYAYGWEIIRDYREWTAEEMRNALGAASPYAYALTSARRLVANSRMLGRAGTHA